MINENKRNNQKISKHHSGSMNNINTQMMNELGELSIKDDEEMTELDLTMMIEKALIKNIKFTANTILEIKGFESK